MNLVYLTTNLVNGKQYVGSHRTKNINDSYIGSGYALIKSIKKYGKENFKREILEYCDDIKEARKLEQIYIEKYNTLTPNGYNISPTGGMGEWCGKHSDESLVKMSISQKKRFDNIEEKEKISKRFSGTYEDLYGKVKSDKMKNEKSIFFQKNNPIKGKFGENNPNFGSKRTEESKKKMSESLKDKPKSEEHKKSLSKAWEKRRINHPVSEETKMKMKNSSKGKINIKIYKVIDPNGNVYLTNEGLTKFCEEHDLANSLMIKVAKGKRVHHKNWKCEYI